jgi:hypothetical protein
MPKRATFIPLVGLELKQTAPLPLHRQWFEFAPVLFGATLISHPAD